MNNPNQENENIENVTYMINSKNIKEDNEYDDPFIEHLFNVNSKYSIQDKEILYGYQEYNNNVYKNCIDAINKKDYNNYNEEKEDHFDYEYEYNYEEKEEEEEEDVLKYYTVVKNNKINDESLQNQIDQLLNFNRKSETYEEKQKKLVLGSLNDDEIDDALYEKEEEHFFFNFMEDLNNLKKKCISKNENTMNYNNNNKCETDGNNSEINKIYESKITDSLNNKNIAFNEKRLLDINNINLNNILYFYFYSNQEYLLQMKNGNQNVYTYDSYIFDNDQLSDISSNLKSSGSSKSSSISDEELLMLKYDDEDYENEEIYFNKKKKKNRERKKKMKKKKNNDKILTSLEPTKMNKEVESLMNKANNCYISKNFDECIIILEKVIKLSPCLHDPFHLLGLIYEREFKNLKKAINYYLIAAHLSHSDFLSWYNIIDLCKIEKQYSIILYCLYKVLKFYKRKKVKYKNKRKDIVKEEKKKKKINDDYYDEEEEEKNNLKSLHEDRDDSSEDNNINEFDNFMKHIYFNISFTYILLEDYKNALKNLFLLKNNNDSYEIIVDIYICICLIIVKSPNECYNFLKSIYFNIMKNKQINYFSFQEKNMISLFMQSQILNNKYDECIFVYAKLTKMSNYIHIDIFMQFIKSVIMIGAIDSLYLIKCYFLNVIIHNYSTYEDLLFMLAESYYARSMYESAIYFYTLIYKKRKYILKKNNNSINDDYKNSSNKNNISNNIENIDNNKNEEEINNNEFRNINAVSIDNVILFDNNVNFLNVIYKLVKSYYYIENFIKAEKIILKILNNENIEKNNIEIDIKTLYIDILYKLKKYNKSINILLSIKEKKLRFLCSIPKPLSNKEREMLLLKILNKKNKLLLYTSHNSYIMHIFYTYQNKYNISYKYDNYLLNRDINDLIQLKVNICFCYFCVKYNFSILNYLYLYNILNMLNDKKNVKKNRELILNIYKFREYIIFLTSSFSVFKKKNKIENWIVTYKNIKLTDTKLFYKDVYIFDLKNFIFNENYENSLSLKLHHANENNKIIIKEFLKNLYKYKYHVESEIMNSKIIMKFYKFSYNLFYLLYELEQDFNRIQTYMEKENLNLKKKRKFNNAHAKKVYEKSVGIISMDDKNLNEDNIEICDSLKLHSNNIESSLINKNNKNVKRYRKFSFLITKKRLNFFTFESYLGLYFSLLFIEECFFLVSIMNLYEDSIHILSLYLKNRKSNKMKFITYIRSIKNEFKKYRNNQNLINLNFYFFDNIFTKTIKEEMKNEYYKLMNANKYIDCKYYIFRINLLLNKLYISSGNYEKQIRCLNDIYTFNKKEKEEYKILKYYSDIVLTGIFCQDFLTSISKSKSKNILVNFRLFLVRTIHYKNSNPFLIYLIGNVCNLSCMIVNAVHEYTRAYTFLLKNRTKNKMKLHNLKEGIIKVDKQEKIEKNENYEDFENYANNYDEDENENNEEEEEEAEEGEDDSDEEENHNVKEESYNFYKNSKEEDTDNFDEDSFLFAKLKLCSDKKRKNEYIDDFENICDNINFLFSLTTSYFNYSSCYRVENRESVMMTSFCLLNEYISKRYEQKILKKKKKYNKYSLFYKVYKYIYLAEILYNMARALHQFSHFNECMKLYFSVIELIKKADKEMKRVIRVNNLNIHEKFIYNYVINMKKCMCYTCLNYPVNNSKTYFDKLTNYYFNLNTKYSNFYLLFFDKKHLLFSASYNLSVIFRKLNRFEQAKYILNNIIWD